MQLTIVRSRRFKKSYKRVSKHKGFNRKVFIHIAEQLATKQKLDRKYKDHKLMGVLARYRECHISPDILLIYKIDNDVLTLTLVNIGNHSNLFT